MKKIIIIDGGPRKNFNTASMLQKFADGASSVSSEIEVKTVHLYALDYKGCMSCMACKMKGKASNVCKFKDALTPMLDILWRCDWTDADILGASGFPLALLQRLQHDGSQAYASSSDRDHERNA